MIKPGFYTIRMTDESAKATVCQVIEGDPEVYVLGFGHYWDRDSVFKSDMFSILAGPYSLPGCPENGQEG